ncbi:dihydrolipoamide acetyltransferase family protein [Pseudokineococcus basanitobsidens]|uniref:Dihydrolipoamide acetyltransferase component of pyruvate dehydrogenase complex n=1 Tax=Pseudokineococcus basanitobsidens TaxID=1926649 RepID=A0ABU8RG87_9ACTN
MALQQFRLPDVGEGLTEAEVVAWRVAVGDRVDVNAVLVEIETAKSLVELPSPFAGVVRELLVDEGLTVEVGTPIVAVEVTGAQGSDGRAEGRDVDASGPDHGPGGGARGGDVVDPDGADDRRDVLVGYGPGRRASRRRPPADAAGSPGTSPAAGDAGAGAEDGSAAAAQDGASSRPLATPPVRKLARDRGVDLAEVVPSGPRGNVTRRDVLAHEETGAGDAPAPAADGEVRVPVRGVRRAMAEAMVRSTTEAPQATLFHTLDVTRTVRLVQRLKQDTGFGDVRVSPLLVAARAVVLALARTPEMGARWDGAAGELVVPGHVHLGIAAATPRGLVVPVVRDAQALGLHDLAAAITELATTAREGRTPPSALTGGTFTVTNIGALGIESGAPILNPGETGILGVGSVARRPWVHRDRVRPRWTTTLSLTVDHRVVDGAQAGGFLADVAAVLERPSQALVWS